MPLPVVPISCYLPCRAQLGLPVLQMGLPVLQMQMPASGSGAHKLPVTCRDQMGAAVLQVTVPRLTATAMYRCPWPAASGGRLRLPESEEGA